VSAVDWTSIKDAIFTWLKNSTGLDPTRIHFGGQNMLRPRGVDDAWISIWIASDDWMGHGFALYKDNPTPTPGAEIIKEIHNQRLVTIEITCYGPRGATDTTEAHVYMSTALSELELDEVSDPLDAAGVGVQQYSSITVIGGTINTTRIEPQAKVMLQFLTPSVVSRTMTFIETVNATVEVTSPAPVKDFHFTFDLDP
jgi:hypothetical protein